MAVGARFYLADRGSSLPDITINIDTAVIVEHNAPDIGVYKSTFGPDDLNGTMIVYEENRAIVIAEGS